MSTPIIQTERLLLRPFARSDAVDVFVYASNPKVSRFTTWSTHRTIADSEAFIEMVLASDRDEHIWAICLASDLRVQGAIELSLVSDHEAELHYVLAEPLWNQGLMTEAARAALAWGLERYPAVARITSRAMSENIASQRVMQHCGMRFSRVRLDRWAKFSDPVEQREYVALRHDVRSSDERRT